MGLLTKMQAIGDKEMPVTICRNARDNHWKSQKLSMEKNTVGNEPYIEKATVLGSFFVLRETYIENT
mgnify:CR=1 FL=1